MSAPAVTLVGRDGGSEVRNTAPYQILRTNSDGTIGLFSSIVSLLQEIPADVKTAGWAPNSSVVVLGDSRNYKMVYDSNGLKVILPDGQTLVLALNPPKPTPPKPTPASTVATLGSLPTLAASTVSAPAVTSPTTKKPKGPKQNKGPKPKNSGLPPLPSAKPIPKAPKVKGPSTSVASGEVLMVSSPTVTSPAPSSIALPALAPLGPMPSVSSPSMAALPALAPITSLGSVMSPGGMSTLPPLNSVSNSNR